MSEVTLAHEPPSCWASEPHWLTEATTVNVASQESLVLSAAGLAELLPAEAAESEPLGLRKVNAPRIRPPNTAPTMNATITPTTVLRLVVLGLAEPADVLVPDALSVGCLGLLAEGRLVC